VRAIHRVLKLARTIADLAEAIQYRSRSGVEL
jgi:predicted ATPase with chaperone activity